MHANGAETEGTFQDDMTLFEIALRDDPWTEMHHDIVQWLREISPFEHAPDHDEVIMLAAREGDFQTLKNLICQGCEIYVEYPLCGPPLYQS